MSGDLTLHKRTLAPIKTLIYGLRRYDADRFAALFESEDDESTPGKIGRGFMSHKSKIYLVCIPLHTAIDYMLTGCSLATGV